MPSHIKLVHLLFPILSDSLPIVDFSYDCLMDTDLKTHIINYSKTREVYAAYKKSRHKKEFLAEHGDEIAKHEAAKKAFDALDGKPIPKVAQLSQEYTALLAEKQEQYAEYKALRQDMIAYRTAKQNVDKILGLTPEAQEQNREQKPER